MIQTFTPDNEIIRLAASQDYEAFYRAELEMRRIQNAPPFCQWAALTASGKSEERVLNALRKCRQMLGAMLEQSGEPAELLGPVPLSVVKVSDRFRYRLQIRCRINKSIRQILSSVLIACSQDREMRDVSIYVENEAGS